MSRGIPDSLDDLGWASPDIPEGHKPAPLLVPQCKAPALKAVAKAEAPGLAKGGDSLISSPQAVARNLDGKMVDVVEADMARQPAQDAREVVKGAAFEGGGFEVPLGLMAPIGALELMLHVEEPDADGTGQHGNGQVADHERAPAEEQHRRHQNCRQGGISAHDAEPALAIVGQAATGNPVQQQELISRPDNEE